MSRNEHKQLQSSHMEITLRQRLDCVPGNDSPHPTTTAPQSSQISSVHPGSAVAARTLEVEREPGAWLTIKDVLLKLKNVPRRGAQRSREEEAKESG